MIMLGFSKALPPLTGPFPEDPRRESARAGPRLCPPAAIAAAAPADRLTILVSPKSGCSFPARLSGVLDLIDVHLIFFPRYRVCCQSAALFVLLPLMVSLLYCVPLVYSELMLFAKASPEETWDVHITMFTGASRPVGPDIASLILTHTMVGLSPMAAHHQPRAAGTVLGFSTPVRQRLSLPPGTIRA